MKYIKITILIFSILLTSLSSASYRRFLKEAEKASSKLWKQSRNTNFRLALQDEACRGGAKSRRFRVQDYTLVTARVLSAPRNATMEEALEHVFERRSDYSKTKLDTFSIFQILMNEFYMKHPQQNCLSQMPFVSTERSRQIKAEPGREISNGFHDYQNDSLIEASEDEEKNPWKDRDLRVLLKNFEAKNLEHHLQNKGLVLSSGEAKRVERLQSFEQKLHNSGGMRLRFELESKSPSKFNLFRVKCHIFGDKILTPQIKISERLAQELKYFSHSKNQEALRKEIIEDAKNHRENSSKDIKLVSHLLKNYSTQRDLNFLLDPRRIHLSQLRTTHVIQMAGFVFEVCFQKDLTYSIAPKRHQNNREL